MKKNKFSVKDLKLAQEKKRKQSQAAPLEGDQGIVSCRNKTAKKKILLKQIKYSSRLEELISTQAQIRSILVTKQVTCKSGTWVKS